MIRLIGADGWPCEFEDSSVGLRLIEAITSLGAGSISEEVATRHAHLLFLSYNSAFDEELPRNRPASQAQSELELTKLEELCSKLSAHIEKMRRPAVSALYREGTDLFSIYSLIEELRENAKHALGPLSNESGRGAPSKIIASDVTRMAAGVYLEITGKEPTFTTIPRDEGATIGGRWPEFLERIFQALQIDASVESQVRALKINRP